MTTSRRKGFLLPGHNYLGPGNPLENGPVKNKADQIAKEHDHQYNKANYKEDIYEADQQAIWEFADNFKESPNIPSFLGAAGLGTKHLVEKSLNRVFYPQGLKGNASY